MMKLRAKMPLIYHTFFSEEVLAVEVPEETLATCNNCNLCRSSQSPYLNTKCCTYHPHLANYLIGGILADTTGWLKEGQARVRRQIAERRGVSPYGIVPPLAYHQLEVENKKNRELFKGAKELYDAMRCPYYDQGNCSIWAYRENLCVTHFCSSVGGATGKFHWGKVNDYVKTTEHALAKYAMVEMNWPLSKIEIKSLQSKRIGTEDDEGQIDEAKYQQLWGDWLGREAEFYIACYQLIQGLSRDKFMQIAGQDVEILEVAIQETALAFHRAILPNVLQLNHEVRIQSIDADKQLMVLGDHSIEVPTVVLPLIKAFNGKRGVAEVFGLAYQVLFSLDELVEQLYSEGFLVPVE